MCTGCGEMKTKGELIRIVKNKEGEISLDNTGKKPGRGAYVCKDKACLLKAQKNRRLEKAFQTKLDDNLFESLQKELSDYEE